MNVIPPEGVTVVIENDTVTVTNQTVDIETAEDDSGDSDSGDSDSGDSDSGDSDKQERKIHQKKGNKIPYLLFVSRIHYATVVQVRLSGGYEFLGMLFDPQGLSTYHTY